MEGTRGHVGTENGLARSDLEFNPTYDARRRSALTQEPEISPGACWLLPTPLSYPGSVTRRPANIFLPEPWTAGSPWTLISSQRGCEAGVTALSLPTSCLPPFLSNHWHQNLTCSMGWEGWLWIGKFSATGPMAGD